MLEITELHIKRELERNSKTDRFEWVKKVIITIEDKTKSFTITLPEDSVKRIISPVIDVIVDAIDIKRGELKRELLETVKQEGEDE